MRLSFFMAGFLLSSFFFLLSSFFFLVIRCLNVTAKQLLALQE